MKTDNVVRVRFTTMLPVGGKQLRQVDENQEWDVQLEGEVVRISTKQETATETVERVTYVPLHMVEFLECAPVSTPKAKPAPAPEVKKLEPAPEVKKPEAKK
jgi:hypothetical protein